MPLPVMDCQTPQVLDALRGFSPAADIRYVQAPEGLGVRDGPPAPPPASKAVYGTNMANHFETENFSINWANGDATDEIAAAAAEALELGWESLINDLGWQVPVSADEYLLWVVLDPSLGGTGFTTQYETDEFPTGYPVVYLNPSSFENPDFFAALAQHEFHHAIQYGYRHEWSSRGDEAWYWEASANWAPYLVDPDSTAFDYTAAWYAENPELKYSSLDGAHQYGMFVLNSFLDDVLGDGTMYEVWHQSGEGDEWAELIAATTGKEAEEIWGQFAAAYGERRLIRSQRWQPVASPSAEDGLSGLADELGSLHYELDEGEKRLVGLEMIDGEAVVSGLAGVGSELEIFGGEVFAVTATSSGGAAWNLTIGDIPVDTGGGDETGSVDTAGSLDDSGDGGEAVDTSDGAGEPTGCGCSGGGGAGAGSALVAVFLAAIRRPRFDRPVGGRVT